MKILGQQFVMGETIEAALQRAAGAPEFDYRSTCSAKPRSRLRSRALFRGLSRSDRRRGRQRARAGRRAEHLVKLSALCPRYCSRK
jgi:hypothetical protein